MTSEHVASLFREAISCRICFQDKNLDIEAAVVDRPQPRWVGEKYWETRPRIAIVMPYPGSGESRSDAADDRLNVLLKAFLSGIISVDDIFKHQRKDMPYWGKGGIFLPFYLTGFGLQLEEIAFANIAWCATRRRRRRRILRRTITTPCPCLTDATSDIRRDSSKVSPPMLYFFPGPTRIDTKVTSGEYSPWQRSYAP